MGFTTQTKLTTGFVNKGGFTDSIKTDLSTLEGLNQQAQQAGLGKEAIKITKEVPRLSVLQRVEKGFGAFNPAEAILTGVEKGAVKGAGRYVGGVITGIGSAVTGKDIEGERRYFKDVAEKIGIENGIAKWGIGFVGDVLLDPSTYFGGALAKGIIGGTKAIGGVGLKGIGKVMPQVEQGIRLTGTGLQDALGRAFQYGYKATKGAKEDVLTFL